VTTKRIGKSILEKTLTRWPVFVDHFNTTTYRIGRVTIGVNDGLGAKVYGWCGNSKKKGAKDFALVEPLYQSIEICA
ncbi:hypothetical protein, partial [Escherichia coli]|uniref:hypothetical protein n=1 Tax=Escherichia coli TaxID=562 RepID=UPI002041E342